MFGNLGQIASLLKNAGQIKQSMKEMNERLATARHVGEAGGGQVQATVDGRADIISLKIDPGLVQAGDVEMIEDLAVAAVRAAMTNSKQAAQQEMQALTGGMGLPNMDELLGGGPQ